MGQATTRHNVKGANAVEREVDELRLRTQSLVEELERRIRSRVDGAKDAVDRIKHAVDVKAQLRENPAIAISIGAGALIAIGLGTWFLIDRGLKRNRPMARIRRQASALGTLVAHPERALRPREPLGRRLIGAIVITASTVLVRKLAEQLAGRVLNAPSNRRRLVAPPI
ncbi:MAG TPA: hypothetical protein VII38_01365 [Polyangia bacterium]|jgi:ElaB/YqjD/DUF883 family membrane-anchored ribosome-binding protein